MGKRYTRTPAHSSEQKARTEKNKVRKAEKALKPKKFASAEVKARKLKVKEAKRQKYLASHPNDTSKNTPKI